MYTRRKFKLPQVVQKRRGIKKNVDENNDILNRRIKQIVVYIYIYIYI